MLVVAVIFLTEGLYVSGLLFLVTGTPPWFLRSMKVSTSSELYPGTLDCFTFARLFRHSFTASATVFEWVFFTHGRSLSYAPSPTFWHILRFR